ncbi:MAG TPA: hypothetical protein VGM17_02430 [Rhizomicrobium sp.]
MQRIASPAERVIRKCGNGNLSKGLRLVSEWCGVHVTAVQRWTYPREARSGGTGGLIPTKHWPAIIARAAHLGVALDAKEFFFTPEELVPGVPQASAA